MSYKLTVLQLHRCAISLYKEHTNCKKKTLESSAHGPDIFRPCRSGCRWLKSPQGLNRGIGANASRREMQVRSTRTHMANSDKWSSSPTFQLQAAHGFVAHGFRRAETAWKCQHGNTPEYANDDEVI